LGLTSILQELPGIGPVKRRTLLRTLGSLRAVRAASEEELAAVPGVSAKDVATIRVFFAALDEAPEPEKPPPEEATIEEAAVED
jgi:excinuclease ABC subunit C